MKRFYCTECKRMKRVRNYPRIIKDAEAVMPTMRQGVCNWHFQTNRQTTKVRKVS